MAQETFSGDKESDSKESKHPGGRPLKFKTVAELELAIQTYFDECDPHIIKHMEATGFNERGETMWRERSIMSEQRPYTRREPAVRSVRERCQVQPDQ
jgi:hypothetical protein